MKQEDQGVCVEAIEHAFILLGVNLAVNGYYGPQTEAAVRAFQESNGLVVDGVTGPATLAALEQALTSPRPPSTATGEISSAPPVDGTLSGGKPLLDCLREALGEEIAEMASEALVESRFPNARSFLEKFGRIALPWDAFQAAKCVWWDLPEDYERYLRSDDEGEEAPGSYLSGILASSTLAGAAYYPAGGHYVATADGHVVTYGAAPFYGDADHLDLPEPIVGIAVSPGTGYWLVAADGRVFAFGDAPFLGSMGGNPLNAPVVGMAATPSGQGYWLVAADGGVFAFGDAPFLGSKGGEALDVPIVGIGTTPSGDGYWIVDAGRRTYPFGDAPATSEGEMGPFASVVAVMVRHDGSLALVTAEGRVHVI